MDVTQRLRELQIQLPELPKPVASYLPAVIHGDIVYASGQTGTQYQQLVYRGKVGAEVTLEEAKESARLAVLNCLAELQFVMKDLNRIERIIRLTGFVASAPSFTNQPQVIEGASALLIEIFGESGWHARSAIGVCALPSDAPVEVELIVSLKS